jgi:hypothetical protein
MLSSVFACSNLTARKFSKFVIVLGKGTLKQVSRRDFAQASRELLGAEELALSAGARARAALQPEQLSELLLN